MIVQFESAALDEYRDAAVYSEKRFGLGEKFVQGVESALEAVSKDPERFQLIREDVRIYRLRRFPYYLFYH